MDQEKKIEELTNRVDELLVILKTVADDLKKLSGSLKSLAVSSITQPETPVSDKPAIERESAQKKSIEDVRMLFPEDLENMLSFEETEGHIKIRPRQFLGSDNFAKIASIVREMGGDYVSAGKESHFRVDRKV